MAILPGGRIVVSSHRTKVKKVITRQLRGANVLRELFKVWLKDSVYLSDSSLVLSSEPAHSLQVAVAIEESNDRDSEVQIVLKRSLRLYNLFLDLRVDLSNDGPLGLKGLGLPEVANVRTSLLLLEALEDWRVVS